MKPERKLYEKLKRNVPQISWIRLENLSLSGTPDLLGYNANHHFFTVELKVTKSNKVRFSPHQIAFHVKHPDNTFIMVKHLGQRSVKLFQGSRIKELVACGLSLDACCLGLDACRLWLEELGLDAWRLKLHALLHASVWPRAPFGAGPSLSSIWGYDTFLTPARSTLLISLLPR